MRMISTRDRLLEEPSEVDIEQNQSNGRQRGRSKAVGHKHSMVAAVPKTSRRCTRFSIGAL
jgi:hypothetical protein